VSALRSHVQDASATHFEFVLAFCIGGVCLIGVSTWVFYAGYGLAAVPIFCLRPPTEEPVTEEYDTTEDDEIDHSLRQTREALRSLSSRYNVLGRSWTAEDKRRKMELEKEEAGLRKRHERNAELRLRHSHLLQAWRYTKRVLRPFRVFCGLVFFLVSLVLVLSLLVTALGRTRSECGWRCGFYLEDEVSNPVDLILQWFSRAYPQIHFLVFVGLTLYSVCSVFFAMFQLGVVFPLGCKLFSLESENTPQSGLLVASWVMGIVLVVHTMQLHALFPQYSSCGAGMTDTQQPASAPSFIALVMLASSVANRADGFRLPSTVLQSTDGCVQTHMVAITRALSSIFPLSSTALWLGGVLLFFSYLWALFRGICAGKKTEYMLITGDSDQRSITTIVEHIGTCGAVRASNNPTKNKKQPKNKRVSFDFSPERQDSDANHEEIVLEDEDFLDLEEDLDLPLDLGDDLFDTNIWDEKRAEGYFRPRQTSLV
jgi:hypothetical protein